MRRVRRTALCLLPGGVLLAACAPGDLDTSFGDDGTQAIVFSRASVMSSVALQSDGRLVSAGFVEKDDVDVALARSTRAGDLDTTFGYGGSGKTTWNSGRPDLRNEAVVQGDDRIVVLSGGSVLRFTASGRIDSTFGGGDGKVDLGPFGFRTESHDGGTRALGVTPTGKIVVGGVRNTPVPPDRNDVALEVLQLRADGTIDTGFGAGGIASVRLRETGSCCGSADDLAVQPNGRILVVGTSEGGWTHLARFTAAGAPDGTFGSGGVAGLPGIDFPEAVDVQPSGRILVLHGSFALRAYTTAGAPDTSFGRSGEASVTIPVGPDNRGSSYDFAIDPSGRPVVGGSGTAGTAVAVRFTPSGQPDTGFGGGDGIASARVGDSFQPRPVAVQPDGSIVVGGAGSDDADGGGNRFVLVRFIG